MLLTLAVLAAFIAVGFACYDAGRFDGRLEAENKARATRALQYALDVEAGRHRHPSGR